MSPSAATRSAGNARRDLPGVIRALADLCAALEPGDRLPTHTELMRRLHASERMVLRALEELQRSGGIVRRNGVGTFVTGRRGAPEYRDPVVPAVLADSRTVVALSRPDHSFFDRCMDLLSQHVAAQDLALVCRIIDREGRAFQAPAPAPDGPLGFLVFRAELAPIARQMHQAGCRVVLVGAPHADEPPAVPSVYGDHEEGGYLATRHLLHLGHRRIAFVGPDELPRTLRWRGDQRALREAARAGTPVHAVTLAPEQFAAWERDPTLAARELRRPDAPTGFVAWNDHEAARLLGVLARAGVNVPGDVSVVGYDALPEGRLVYPPLTTVDQGIGQQLRAALDLLTAPVVPPPTHTVITLPALIQRQSTAPPPAA